MHHGLRWQAMKQKCERLRDFASWCRPGLPALCCTGPWPHWPHWPQAAGWPAGAAGPRAPCLGLAPGPRRSPAVLSRLKKTTESLVTSHVNQALEDLIMVSYTGPGDRLFQGVLLDATKRFNTWNMSPKSSNSGSFRFWMEFFGCKTMRTHLYF